MKYLLSLLAVAFALVMVISNSSGASIPETPDNTIVLEVASKGSLQRSGPSDPEDQDDPFEIVVPVARNFSSLEELFRILREDDPNEPQVATGTPLSYVKGTERNASDFMIFFSDGVGKGST